MICDLCDKDQQSICERSFHFIKPINECLMRKAQENKQIIEELENIKEEMLEGLYDLPCDFNYGIAFCTDVLDKHISKLKGENNG